MRVSAGDLSKRSISFFAFCFKIRCKRSHGKIRVVQKGYYCDQKKGRFFFGRQHFTWRPAFCQLITVTYKRFRIPDSGFRMESHILQSIWNQESGVRTEVGIRRVWNQVSQMTSGQNSVRSGIRNLESGISGLRGIWNQESVCATVTCSERFN